MATHDLRIASEAFRATAHQWVDRAPVGCVIKFEPEPTRSNIQNSKMWAMLGDISKQCLVRGEKKSAETWKLLAMKALKHECAFEIGLDGEPFPVGFRSSQLSVKQMAELIEWLYAYGAENDVKWTERGWDET